MGRPKILDEDLIESWCEAIATGLTPRLVCYRIGIDYGGSCKWLQQGREDAAAGKDTIEARFFSRHARARVDRSSRWLEIVDQIAVAGEKDGDRQRAATWLLEHCDPEEFGAKSKVELTGANEGPVQVAATVVLVPSTAASAEEWLAGLGDSAPAGASDG